MNKIKFILSKLIGTIVSISVILIVIIGMLVTKNESYSTREKRNLEMQPAFSFADYLEGEYQKHYDSYLSDQFPNREMFHDVKTEIEYGLGKRKFSDVYVGKNEMLFQSSIHPSDAKIKEFSNALNTFQKRYPKLKMYMMLFPNKISVYNENATNHVSNMDQSKDIKKLYDKLEKYQKIDVLSQLKKAKKDYDYLYYQSDHHATSDAAMIVYKQFIKLVYPKDKIPKYNQYVVNNEFVGTLSNRSGYFCKKKDVVKVWVPKKSNVSYLVRHEDASVATSVYNSHKAKSDNPYEVFLGGNEGLIEIDTNLKADRNILIIKDSYANSLISLLVNHYHKIIIVDPRYYYDDINELIKQNQIQSVLFCYNANTFFEDSDLVSVIGDK